MVYKDRGIVIKQVDYGEADRILSVITANHGKISAIAKGVRRLKSRKANACGLFVESQFVFAEGKTLDLITEADAISSFDSIKDELERVSVLFYISELLDRMVEGNDELNGWSIFELLQNFLQLAEYANEKSIFNLVRGFEARLLSLLGLTPELYFCVSCKQKLKSGDQLSFDIKSGGIRCEGCSDDNGSRSQPISLDSIKSLRFFYNHDLKSSVMLQLNDSVRSEIKRFNQSCLEYFHGFQINSKGIYKI